MTKSRIVFGVCLIIWMFVLFLGFELYSGVVAQKVAGYPKPGQLYLCFLFPCAFLVLNILIIIFSRKLHWVILIVAFLTQFIAFLTFFLLAAGGV